MNKKAFNYSSDWAEILALALLFIGVIVGVLSPSAAVTYLIAIFAGMLMGRIIWSRKKKMKAPYVLIVIGFILGFVIGTFRGDRRIALLLCLLGLWASYFFYKKGFVKDVLT